MTRRAVTLLVVCGVLVGCGSGPRPASRSAPKAGAHKARSESVSIQEIEAQNRAARRRERQAAPSPTPTATPTATSLAVPKPPITPAFIPFGPQRKQEMAAYAQRHYGLDSYRLVHPKVIVEHYTVTADARAAVRIFTPDVADTELHELPGTCSHFVIDRDGTILQLVPLQIMCRHTVGLNDTAIGIEHAGFSDQDVLGNRRELRASLALTRWLRCRYGIAVSDVIGHHESLSSPYHHERVPSLRTQTHEDFTKPDMDVYRHRLRALPC